MDLFQPPLLFVLIAVAIAVIALVAWIATSAARERRERERLRERYGAEYERTVAEHRTARAAVADLKDRETEYERLELHSLNDADRELIRRHLAAAQFRFVEDPADALMRTERIMVEVLRAQGYPVSDDREHATKLFSVAHPGHAQSVRTMFGDHHVGTDELRDRFLQARKTISDVTGTSYEAADALVERPPLTELRRDLRVEREISPSDSTRTS